MNAELARIIRTWEERTDTSVSAEQAEYQPNWTVHQVWQELSKGLWKEELATKRRYWAKRLTAKCLGMLKLFATESEKTNIPAEEWLETTEKITFEGGEGGISTEYTKDLRIRLKWKVTGNTYKLTKSYPDDGYEETFEVSSEALTGDYPTFSVSGKFTPPFAAPPYEIGVECDKNSVINITYEDETKSTMIAFKD